MRDSNIKNLFIALCLAVMPMTALAAGLGKLNISSGIGEPLIADIELLSVSASELSKVTANIAPTATYAAQGIDRPASHNDIKVNVTKNASGKPILKLRSNTPITEPFLDMLIQLDWQTGRLLREYTVLLDPPGYKATITAQPTQAPTVQSAAIPQPTAPEPTPQHTTASQTLVKKTSNVQTAAPVEQSLEDEYLTKRGDTLSKIARRMKPEGVSLDQMLVGLYEANKQAFSGNNMNRLNVGKIIRAPSEQELTALTRKAASREVKVQTVNWNAYRNKLAGIVADSAPVESEDVTQSTSGAIKPATEDKSEVATDKPKDVVKLSAGEDGNSAEAKSLQTKIAALQEEVTAREKGLAEAQGRTAALEKQVADLQKLLALKNNALAGAQEEAENSAAAAEEAAKEEAVTGAIKQTETAEATDNESVVKEKAADEKSSDKTDVAKEALAQAEVNSVEAAKADADAKAAALADKTKADAAKQAKPKPAPAPAASVAQPNFIESIMEGLDQTMLAAGAGLIALLAAGWGLLRYRRKKNLADFEQGIMTSGGLKANTVFGNTSGASVDTGDTSFLTDFSQSANGGMIDTQDVDPIAEAEVYMAYGRDAQAEEILKDAISKEPKRYELHLKLLEMYAASKNMSAFETVSGELYTTLGADDPTWAKVAEIGIKLEPNNPLYQVSNTGAVAAEGEAKENLDASDFSETPLADEADLDFSFEAEKAEDKPVASAEVPPAAEAPKEEDPSAPLDFNVESDAAAEIAGTPTIPLTETPNEQSASDGVDAISDALEMDDAEAPKETIGKLDFDLGELESPELETPELDVPDLNMPDAAMPAATAEDQANFEHTLPSLDFPETEATETDTIEPAAEGVSEMPEDALNIEADKLEGSIEEKLETNAAEGFDFNLGATAEDEKPVQGTDEAVLDLSGISLDAEDAPINGNGSLESLSDETPEIVTDQTAEAASVDTEADSAASDEPAEVETKLELIAAYIDMEDKEGAKELLDEVMKEGGVSQKKRAEDLLSQLG